MVTARWNLDRSDPTHITERFAAIGAVANVRLVPALHSDVRLDLESTVRGEVFDIRFGARAGLHVLDVDQSLRQVLLASGGSWRTASPARHFLCGRDEQHWFVASVPGKRGPVTSVAEAFEALKPDGVLEAQGRSRLSDEQKLARANVAYIRQGEWFFVPRPKMVVPHNEVLRHEPIQRVRGKPHYLEFAHRKGGRLVWVSAQHPEGISAEERNVLLQRDEWARGLHWFTRQIARTVYAKGRVTHPDHKPAFLRCWHEVFISTEHEAADGSVTFLD